MCVCCVSDSRTNWFPSVLWHCWLGHMTCKNRFPVNSYPSQLVPNTKSYPEWYAYQAGWIWMNERNCWKTSANKALVKVEMKVQWFKVHSKATRSWLSLTHWLIQPLSRVKSLDDPRVRVISPIGKEKVYGGKDLLKSQVSSSEWNTERVKEDVSGDSEDGEDDELSCVIGESAGDCVWRGSRR